MFIVTHTHNHRDFHLSEVTTTVHPMPFEDKAEAMSFIEAEKTKSVKYITDEFPDATCGVSSLKNGLALNVYDQDDFFIYDEWCLTELDLTPHYRKVTAEYLDDDDVEVQVIYAVREDKTLEDLEEYLYDIGMMHVEVSADSEELVFVGTYEPFLMLEAK